MAETIWVNGLPDNTSYARYGEPPEYGPPEPWEILASHDFAGSWEFAMLVVWQDKLTGELRAAADSGCSCPTPFGDLTMDAALPIRKVADLQPLIDWLGDEIEDRQALRDLEAKVRAALSETDHA
jgi:hypothetical protein